MLSNLVYPPSASLHLTLPFSTAQQRSSFHHLTASDNGAPQRQPQRQRPQRKLTLPSASRTLVSPHDLRTEGGAPGITVWPLPRSNGIPASPLTLKLCSCVLRLVPRAPSVAKARRDARRGSDRGPLPCPETGICSSRAVIPRPPNPASQAKIPVISGRGDILGSHDTQVAIRYRKCQTGPL